MSRKKIVGVGPLILPPAPGSHTITIFYDRTSEGGISPDLSLKLSSQMTSFELAQVLLNLGAAQVRQAEVQMAEALKDFKCSHCGKGLNDGSQKGSG